MSAYDFYREGLIFCWLILGLLSRTLSPIQPIYCHLAAKGVGPSQETAKITLHDCISLEYLNK